MIHYHGGPITPTEVAVRAWYGRHGMVSFAYPDSAPLAAEICQSFALDNGAFSVWKAGRKPDWPAYYEWVDGWIGHPGFDFALIPDSIEGGEAENDELLAQWPHGHFHGVPVWHLHESLERLDRLTTTYPRVALGSSGEYAEPGNLRWWSRISEAMKIVCDESGIPRTKLHGLRMLDPTIFSHIPLSSADSTNVARNTGLGSRWRGSYQPVSEAVKALVLIDRIESHASSPKWYGTCGVQKNLGLIG